MNIDPLLMETDISPTNGASYSMKVTLYMRRFWVETCNELRYDLKLTRPTRWRRPVAEYFTWFLFGICALGQLVYCLIFPLYIMNARIPKTSATWNYCAPDGSFSLEPTNSWKPAWVFQITLGFGSLTFTQAKAIDIVWDIVSSPSTCDLIAD